MIVPRGPQVRRMIQYVGRPLVFLVVWDLLIVIAFKGLHWEWVGSKVSRWRCMAPPSASS